MNSIVGFFVGIIHAVSAMFGLGHLPPAPVDIAPDTQAEQSLTPQQVVDQFGTLPHGVTSDRPAPLTATKAASPGISVLGMTKYTDSDFGFSFWYPSSWKVDDMSESGQGAFRDTTDKAGNLSKGRIFIRGDGVEIDIDKVYSEDRIFDVNPGACGYCGPLRYFYDVNQHAWMKVYPQGPNGAPDASPDFISQAKNPVAADISNNTMGGLHIFSTEQKENAAIVPLSARHFLQVTGVTYTAECASGCAKYVKGDQAYLTRTIVATDPSVATPVSAEEQIEVIQAAKKAYAGE